MKKSKIISCLLILIFFLNINNVKAVTETCSAAGAASVCNYKNSNNEYFRIKVCFDENDEPGKYFFVYDAKDIHAIINAEDIKYGKKGDEYNYTMLNSFNSRKMDNGGLYISSYSYKSIVKSAKDYISNNLDNTNENSKYCPKKIIYFNNGHNNFCLNNSENNQYCNSILSADNVKEKATFSTLANSNQDGLTDKQIEFMGDNNKPSDANLNDSMNELNYQKASKLECAGLLGSVTNPDEPAYYISMSFNIIKYLATILLIVFTIVDYIKAVVSKDDEELSKTNAKFVKRFIFAIIIFVLPSLIIMVLEWGGLINDPSICGI